MVKKLNCPEDLVNYIKLHKEDNLIKSMIVRDNYVSIKIHRMRPGSYDFAEYIRTFSRLSRENVVGYAKRLYEGLDIPEIEKDKNSEWDKQLQPEKLKDFFGISNF